MRTPNGAEFQFFAHDWWASTRETTHEHNYRSRFVAMEFNTHKVNGLYASTPPLEALKLLISDAATRTSDTFKEEEEEEKGDHGERCRTSVFRSIGGKNDCD